MLVTTGYGWGVLREFSSGLTKSSALGGSSNGVSGTGTNVLVMGLDSRLDQNGNPLPAAVLDQLHAGDSSNGGYNTNVLMLVHLPGNGDGARPVGISIPRDAYVGLPGEPSGTSRAKIKEGYGLAKAEAEHTLRARGVTDRQALEHTGREAGRKQTVATVQDLLGVKVDHIVEVTLVGFYDLAQALGQVTVCVTGPTQDSYSGARFNAGQQQLDAAQALAFVRQRRDYVHPDLNFTDLDRARRQQAFLASAAYQLKSAGTLTNPARLHDLIEVAAKDIVIDDGLDLLGLSEQAPRLTGGGLSFTTLPVKAFATVEGQAVDLIDEVEIKKVVHGLLEPAETLSASPPPARLPAATVEVTNASGRDGLAGRLVRALAARGLTPGPSGTERTIKTHSTLSYSPDAAPAGHALAGLLSRLTAKPDPTLERGHLRLVLGADFTAPTGLAGEDPGPGGARSSGGAEHHHDGGQVPASSLHTDAIPCVK
jgi:LCP family protein required for cell wall assembly